MPYWPSKPIFCYIGLPNLPFWLLMIRFRTSMLPMLLALVAIIPMGLSAQSLYQLDPSVPAQILDANTKLTVLGSRLGSRLSMSLVTQEQGLHTGTMGYDNDQHRALLVQATLAGQVPIALRTGHLAAGSNFAPTQFIRLGLNTYQVEGQSNDLTLKFTVVSPFTPTDSLGEVEQIKTSIAPIHYLIVEATNNTNTAQVAKVQVGLNGIPYDRDKEVALSWWRRGKAMQELFFKDVAGSGSLTALAASGFEATHFELGSYQGLGYSAQLAPKATDTKVYILAGHYSGKVMHHVPTSQDLVFYYNRFWKDIDQVLAYAKQNQSRNLRATAHFERALSASNATPEEKWVVAIAFRTDLANSFLLQGAKDEKPRFYLTEGRFRHMNTLDVAYETEMMALFMPWRLKMQLEQWTDYLATKEVQVPSGRRLGVVKENLEGVSATEFGPFLFHDVGNFPYVFAAEGYDFGPVMPVEENCSFALLLYYYWKLTGDDAFVKRHIGLTEVLMQSLLNRDSNGNGIADYAFGWSSYDVSEAIKRSPDNLYLGVKQLCAYECVAEMLIALPHIATKAKTTPLKSTDEDGTTLDGNGKALFEKAIMDNRYLRAKQAATLHAEAAKISVTLSKTNSKFGYLPVSLDASFKGWDQHSIVICEGLFLPGLAGCQSPILKKLAPMLGNNYVQALAKSTSSYGVRLSDGEEVTWFSKVMVADGISSYWFDKPTSNAKFTYNWNRNNHQAYQDGAFSDTKEWPGNWYPRGVSSIPYLYRGKKLAGPALKRWAEDFRLDRF
jgi:hypothetical protein